MASNFENRHQRSGKQTPAPAQTKGDSNLAAELDASTKRSRIKRSDLGTAQDHPSGPRAPVGTQRKNNRKNRRSPSLSKSPAAAVAVAGRKRADKKPIKKGKAAKLPTNIANVAFIAQPPRVTMKPEQTVTLGNGSKVAIFGLRDEDGTRYIHFCQGRRNVATRYEGFHGSGSEGSTALRRGGIVLVGSMDKVRKAVEQIKRFPAAKIVSKPGGSQYGFAAANGRVYVANGQPCPLVTFTPESGILDQGGTLDDWVERVAAPIAEHLLPSFLLMTMFAGPLLRWTDRTDNIGLEISGAGGCGKSTCQYLMASAAGPAIGDGETTYWRSLNTTNNALETVMKVYNDMTLILDEAGLVEGAGNADTRAATMRGLAFRLGAGQVKHRFGEPAGPRSRLVYVLSTNQPISSLLGSAHAAEADPIADRLITLPILSERPYGIFDSCPPSYASTGDFADALKRAAAENYGHALPAYLTYLVNEAARRPKRLRRKINEYVADFIRHAGTNMNDGSQLRVAQAIGLIYAGGRLAKEAGVLPVTYRCGHTALAALELHCSQARVSVSFDDRLFALMRNAATIDLAKMDINSLSEDVRSRCPVFLYTGKTGSRELLIPIRYMDSVFPGWKALSDNGDFVQRLNPPEGRKVRDRPIGQNGALQPVYRFNVTDLEP